MGYCPLFAGDYAGQGGGLAWWFAGGTTVFYLLPVLMGNAGYRGLPKGVVFILPYYQDTVGASFFAITASITFVCINTNEEIARTIYITIVDQHFISDPFLSQ